jgi:uncharacterized UPF0160 family protein
LDGILGVVVDVCPTRPPFGVTPGASRDTPPVSQAAEVRLPLQAATHSGPFHADDVLAWALIQLFYAPDANLVRTRDPAVLAGCDLVFDVGGEYDPSRGRFDHHQTSYRGSYSSAGMVLRWLEDTGHVDAELASLLRAEVVDYVDAVDNGRVVPQANVPCFARMVEAYTQGPEELGAYDGAFDDATRMAAGFLRGIVAGLEQVRRAESAVLSAMDDAVREGRAVLFLDQYHKWKPTYYAHGGADHPTDFVLFPGMEGSWRVVAIAPEEDSFAQKRPFPSAWGGLTNGALEQVTGVPGSLFCHKNLFIAVFSDRDAAITALEKHGLLYRVRGAA